jgi:hypothetical protein
MNTRLTLSWLLAIVLTGTPALPASAQGIYKTIAADGAMLFSDTPPPSDTRTVPQETDPTMARAHEQVDLAEHAFALARQGLWSPRDGLRLAATRMKPGDQERVAFYTKGVQIARQQLIDLLQARQAPVHLAAR